MRTKAKANTHTQNMRKVTKEDHNTLNQDVGKIGEWSCKYEMKFSAKKCSFLDFDKCMRRIAGSY